MSINSELGKELVVQLDEGRLSYYLKEKNRCVSSKTESDLRYIKWKDKVQDNEIYMFLFVYILETDS